MHQQLQQLLVQQGSLPKRSGRTERSHIGVHSETDGRMDAPSARAAREAEALLAAVVMRGLVFRGRCCLNEGEEPRQAVAECLGRQQSKAHCESTVRNLRGAPLDLKAELCSHSARSPD